MKLSAKKLIEFKEIVSTPFWRRVIVVNRLAEKYLTNALNILIAYDLQKDKQLMRADQLLAHKYEKWGKKGYKLEDINLRLIVARDTIFRASSLNCQIRTLKNKINWNYGENVVLQGKTEGVIAGPSEDVGEQLLRQPWENKGEFFNLPLNQEDIILIGPRKDLEPHLSRLQELNVRFAYIESLSDEQKTFFNVPSKLV